MPDRHGNWPLHIPPDQGSEDWTLATQLARPITSCPCDCMQGCGCPPGVCICEGHCPDQLDAAA